MSEENVKRAFDKRAFDIFENSLALTFDKKTLKKIRYHYSTVNFKTLLCPCRHVIDEDIYPYGPYHSPDDSKNKDACVFAHSLKDLRMPPPREFSPDEFEDQTYASKKRRVD